jgi:N utilization substance protein A
MKFNITSALKELQKQRGIPYEEMRLTLELALISSYRKNYNFEGELLVEIGDDEGEIRMMTYKKVVENVEDPDTEISLEEALSISGEVESGDQIQVDITPGQFGRVAAQTARQVIMQKIREVDQKNVYDRYSNKIGDLVMGKIQRFEKGGDILLELEEGVEGVMPIKEQIPFQRFRQGEIIKSVIVDVKRSSRGTQITLSRTRPDFLKRLFEREIPEIPDRIVEIKSVSREPGVRSKIAVFSAEEHIDPVGSCVGLRGSRIQVIVNELFGEKIDIVRWSPDMRVYVSNALAPAKPNKIEYHEEENRIFVVVPDSQLSLAIGRDGQNVRLAARLAHLKIDIVKESDYIKNLK